ncbi:MAG: DUF5995 family protein [Myxococcota bacterium]
MRVYTKDSRTQPVPNSVDSASPRGLAALADPATLQGPEDLLTRLVKLEEGLRGDGRVVFPAVYTVITRAALVAVGRGDLRDRETSRALITEFGRRYLSALHADLTGGDVPRAWRSHFEKARAGGPSLRAAAAGINAHLTYDLAQALQAAGAGPDYQRDFGRFGEALAASTPGVNAALARHGVDSTGLFQGWFVGNAIDSLIGTGTTSRLGFQTIRAEAWQNSQGLQQCDAQGPLIRGGMLMAVRARELVLDALVKS